MPYYYNAEKRYYEVFFYVKINGKRKQIHRRGFKTVKLAKEFERNYIMKYNNSTEVLFKTLFESYIGYSKSRNRVRTWKEKINISHKYLTYFQNMKLNEITSLQISNWQNDILGLKYSENYPRKTNTQLLALFKYGEKIFHIKNPVRNLEAIGSYQKKKPTVWTIEHFNTFIKTIKNEAIKVGFCILYWTGLRIGELLALTSEDINFENLTINIDKT